MDFATLALIALVALLGPLLALPRRWHLPVVLGELVAGVALGRTGADLLHPGDKTFSLLAAFGFALVMFVAGSHVPLRDPNLHSALRLGALRAAGVGAVAVPLAVLIATAFGTGHIALYAVLLASSSAALVLPIVDSLRLGGPPILQALPQIAVADAACIVALPLAVDPAHAGRAALGVLAVLGSAAVLFVVLRRLETDGIRRRVHHVSENRKFAIELRINLVILFAVTEGFLGPLFFVWLGASLDLRDLATHPSFILLGVLLGLGAVAVHTAMGFTGQPLSVGALASAQLGVPVAAATVGTQLHVLKAGESAALLLGALVATSVAVLAGGAAVRAGMQLPRKHAS